VTAVAGGRRFVTHFPEDFADRIVEKIKTKGLLTL